MVKKIPLTRKAYVFLTDQIFTKGYANMSKKERAKFNRPVKRKVVYFPKGMSAIDRSMTRTKYGDRFKFKNRKGENLSSYMFGVKR